MTLIFITLVTAAIGSLGAPLITPVARTFGVSLIAAQWTLTLTLLVGAVATPLLGRLGSGPRRRVVVLSALAVVVIGSVITVLPVSGTPGFVMLLVGRGAQGVGVGLTALTMATARDHLGDRAARTIALLSVASTARVGLGYPVAGLLTQIGGVRSAYGFGLAVTAAALFTAGRVLPRDTSVPDTPAEHAGASKQPRSVDWVGAVLLSAGLVAVLLVTSMTHLWIEHARTAAVTLSAGLLLLVAWVTVERRAPQPLVNLAALRHPAVAGANLVTIAGAVGVYVPFTLITRYAQTEPVAGYGFGLTDFESGLVVVPFSVLGFFGGRVAARLQGRVGPFALLAANGTLACLACCLFATARDSLVWPVMSMVILGAAVGGFWAAMPGAILTATPIVETAEAMSLNQLLRSAGFSIGSAITGMILAAHTSAADRFPTEPGYSTAAWAGAAVLGASIVLALLTGVAARHRARPVAPPKQSSTAVRSKA